MKKKFLALLTSSVIALSFVGYLLPQSVKAALPDDYFTYEIKEDGTIKIKSFDINSGVLDVVIPSEIDGYTVTEIYRCYSESITSVTIPDTVTKIEDGAFNGCRSLTEVNFGNSVETIGTLSFTGCYSLTSIEFPDSLKSIGTMAFLSDMNLKEVKCGSSLEVVGQRAFDYCIELESIEFNSSLKEIGEQAFIGCAKLESIEFGADNILVNQRAFAGCTSLKSIKIDGDADLFEMNSFAFIPIESFEITGSVRRIENYAFYGCEELTDLTFGGGMEEIGYYSFVGCLSLPSIDLPSTLTSLDTASFAGLESLESVTIDGTLLREIPITTFDTCEKLKTVTIGEGVETINHSAFRKNPLLETVVIPNSIKSIEDDAFSIEESPSLKFVCNCDNEYAIDYAKRNSIPVELVHSYDDGVVIDSTCVDEGSTTYTCSACGDVVTAGITINPDNHQNIVTDNAVAATTTTTGLTEGSHCADCGTVIVKQEVVPTLTPAPTTAPTNTPTVTPTVVPTAAPTPVVTTTPAPTVTPTATPTAAPTAAPTTAPSNSSDALIGEFAERLYTTCLNRTSDPSGKAYWISELKAGKPGADVAREFFFSKEFKGFGLDDKEYVTRLYKTFMDREPDQSGLDYWLGQLNAGKSREYVFDGFINSTEWANVCLKAGIVSGGTAKPTITKVPSQATIDFTTRMYTTCLGRTADVGGVNYWSAELANMRKSGTQVAYEFFFSKEFNEKNLDDKEFVTRLYRTFMGREPEVGGFNFWLNQLANGASRKAVFDGFSTSQEFANLCAEAGILR